MGMEVFVVKGSGLVEDKWEIRERKVFIER